MYNLIGKGDFVDHSRSRRDLFFRNYSRLKLKLFFQVRYCML